MARRQQCSLRVRPKGSSWCPKDSARVSLRLQRAGTGRLRAPGSGEVNATETLGALYAKHGQNERRDWSRKCQSIVIPIFATVALFAGACTGIIEPLGALALARTTRGVAPMRAPDLRPTRLLSPCGRRQTRPEGAGPTRLDRTCGVAHERITALETVREHLAADAAVTVAALAEPDDDAYLAARDAAQAFDDPAPG